ncbi:MAG: signal peptidase [Planctomycetota bacterium]|nr:MAG: signal peptidase [Planctomycetota bacterium]
MHLRYVVRFGTLRNVAEFSTRGSDEVYCRGNQVIVRSPRGIEWGEVLCEASDRTKSYLGGRDVAGKIQRLMTADDQRQREEIWKQEQAAFLKAREIISEQKLAMQLVDVEQLLGGERLTFYYTSEARIDFRDLLKAMAQHFQLRVEMRSISIREEAKVLADYGDCGKPVCCNTHLTEMPPVSMKMAKLQKASLDPNKLSGRCGRLKCCLRYEYDTYEEYRHELPGVGKFVVTKEGKGKVLAQEILAKKVLIGYEDNRRVLVDANDIVTVVSAPGGARQESAGSDNDRDESRP